MNVSDKIQEEYKVLKTEESAILGTLKTLDEQKQQLSERLQKIQQSLYERTIFLCHINEIFRIAKIQFSRLRKETVEVLTLEDLQELNKWMGRVKSEQGFKDIIDALNELGKYKPSQVTTSIYALCQKIIIGGAYKKSK